MKDEAFDLQYERDESVNPLELVERVSLPLHHHIAPAEDDDGQLS